jgi:hypothetical protein
LALPPLDGLVMANSLHFVQHKDGPLQQARGYLKAGNQPASGRFLLVEYNTDQGNHWVPYPLSYQTWVKVAARHGFDHTELCATYPSRFLQEIYTAVSW